MPAHFIVYFSPFYNAITNIGKNVTIQIQKSSCYACDSNTGSWDVNHRRKTELWWPHVIWHYMGSPLTLTSIVKTGQANRWHHLPGPAYSHSKRDIATGGGGV